MRRTTEMMNKRVAIYARVSTKDQDPTSQLLDLRRYCEQREWEILHEFVDIGFSGSKDNRPQLNALMDLARKRKIDLVLVFRFDRFARSTVHLLRSLEEFRQLGIGFTSYQENIDTSSPLGQAMFTIVAAIAQLEKSILVERVNAGLRKAKEMGKAIGRPRVALDKTKLMELKARGLSMDAIGASLGVSAATVCRTLKAFQNPI